MTQFALIRDAEPGTPASKLEPHLCQAALAHFGTVANVRTLDGPSGRPIHELCNDAYTELRGGASFEKTTLFETIVCALHHEFIMWWASDFTALPTFHSRDDVLEAITDQLIHGSGEIYVKYVPR